MDAQGTNIQTARQRYLTRFNALRTERASWLEHWRELSDYLQPRKSRFMQSDVNKGPKKNGNIVNNTGGRALRILAAGMMAGITSPARKWFQLTTHDPALSEVGSVKEWLGLVQTRMLQRFARSNLYNVLHKSYANLGCFGTTAFLIEDDAEDGLRAYDMPVGQYCLANSDRLRVDTLYRELSMTVAQLVQKFGLANVSPQTKADFERNHLDRWVNLLHLIEPNGAVQHGVAGPRGMANRSVWMELGGTPSGQLGAGNFAGGDMGILRESGYEEFPVMAPRWDVTGEDVYGSSPGMDALGDTRALQLLEKRKAQAVEKLVNPPMRGPMSLQSQRASLLPGDITYSDANNPAQVFAPAMEINPQAIPAVEGSIREHEQRINADFYADLWLMLAESDGTQVTAREVVEKHEEKMLQLGPVMERITDELLDPTIERCFRIMLRRGEIPPPPDELQGQDLGVEYLSIMAQAQKLLGTSGIERLSSFVGNLAAAKPEVLDKIDFDQVIDEYSNMLGTPPGVVRTDEQVAAIRQARAQQQQQAAQAQQAAAAVQGAKVLSETDTGGDNALTQLMGNLGGVAGAGPH